MLSEPLEAANASPPMPNNDASDPDAGSDAALGAEEADTFRGIGELIAAILGRRGD